MAPGTRYSPHPGLNMEDRSRRRLEHTTGRSLEQWVELIRAEGLDTDKERVASLKSVHGLGTQYAMWIVECCAGRAGAENYHPDRLVDAQFAGGKEWLRPIFEAVLDYALALGPDAKVCPCATMVPMYRKHVFAQLKAPNLQRLDLGLALGDTPADSPLIDTGGYAKRDRITHRIELASLGQFDQAAKSWLRAAYERTPPGDGVSHFKAK